MARRLSRLALLESCCQRAARATRRDTSALSISGRLISMPVRVSACGRPAAATTIGWPMPCNSGSATRYCTESAGRPSGDRRHCVALRSVRRMALKTGTLSLFSAAVVASRPSAAPTTKSCSTTRAAVLAGAISSGRRSTTSREVLPQRAKIATQGSCCQRASAHSASAGCGSDVDRSRTTRVGFANSAAGSVLLRHTAGPDHSCSPMRTRKAGSGCGTGSACNSVFSR